MLFNSLEPTVVTFVYLVLFGVKLWATIDAIMRPAAAYVAADKMTKTAWLWITGLSLASHILPVGMIFWLIGTVASFVYIVDVKPALVAVIRRR